MMSHPRYLSRSKMSQKTRVTQVKMVLQEKKAEQVRIQQLILALEEALEDAVRERKEELEEMVRTPGNGQKMRDIYHALIGKPAGLANSGNMGTKKKLMEAILKLEQVTINA